MGVGRLRLRSRRDLPDGLDSVMGFLVYATARDFAVGLLDLGMNLDFAVVELMPSGNRIILLDFAVGKADAFG